MADIHYMHRRQHLTSLALASLGDCPRWDAALTTYLRANEIQWAFGEWGPYAQASDARQMAVIKHGADGKKNNDAAVEIAALSKVEDDQRAIWEDDLLPQHDAATFALARTPAPNVAAAVFKAQMIDVEEVWNTTRFDDDCLQIIRDDFARLEGTNTDAFDPEPQEPSEPALPDAELLAAWERRRTTFACYNTLPWPDEPGGDPELNKAMWAVIDAAEEVIYQTPAKTPQGVSFKLLTGLGHTFTDSKHSNAANVGDLLAVVDEDKLDWNEKLIVSAVRSLQTMDHCTEVSQPQLPYEELKRLGLALEERARHATHMLTAIDDALEGIPCGASNNDALDRALSFLGLAKKGLAECSKLAEQVEVIGIGAGRA